MPLEIQKKIQQSTKALEELLNDISIQKENYMNLNYIAKEMDNRGIKLIMQMTKKAILSRVVNRVYLGKDDLKIEFNWIFQNI